MIGPDQVSVFSRSTHAHGVSAAKTRSISSRVLWLDSGYSAQTMGRVMAFAIPKM
jgi:hypothetical protein